MRKLAKRLALAYDKAPWCDLETDIELCVWVRSQCGRELNLQQAADLRDLLEIEIAAFPKIAIFVKSGAVETCKSNDPRLRVYVIDRDREEAPNCSEKMALFDTEDCTHDAYP